MQIPQNIELKLSQNINASKFNRRRYPTQTDYEYASPKPDSNLNKGPQSPFKQITHTPYHQVYDVDSDSGSKIPFP